MPKHLASATFFVSALVVNRVVTNISRKRVLPHRSSLQPITVSYVDSMGPELETVMAKYTAEQNNPTA